MESRLKERLTGAAIIVALIVLLVPEMFRGQRNDSTAPSTTSSSGDGPPIRSYTIDLSNAPIHSAPAATVSPSSVPSVVASAPVPTVSGSSNSAVSAATPAAASDAASSPPESAAPAAPAPTKPVTTSATHAGATVHAPTHAEAPPATAGAAGGWSVQLGIFAKRDNAERLMHAAQQKGFTVSVSGVDAKGQYRVHATGLGDRGSAQNLANRLKQAGFAAAVVSPQ